MWSEPYSNQAAKKLWPKRKTNPIKQPCIIDLYCNQNKHSLFMTTDSKMPADFQDYQPLHQLPPEPMSPPSSSFASTHNRILWSLPLIGTNITLTQLRYITFLALGISILWPWNCLLSLSSHYVYKFGPGLGDNFTSSVMTVSTMTTLIMSAYLSTKPSHFHRRMKIGSLTNISAFILLALLEWWTPEDQYGPGSFATILCLVFISSLGTCLTQNGTMSVVNFLGERYAQGVMVGQAVAGVVPSLALMVSNYIYAVDYSVSNGKSGRGSDMSTVAYFALTSVIAFVALIMVVVNEKSEDNMDDDLELAAPKAKDSVPFASMFEKLRFLVLTIFTVFLFSLVFPIFAGGIKSVNHEGDLAKDELFIPLAFFVWNLGDFAGRVACSSSKVVIHSDVKLFLYAILRSMFIPLFFLCNMNGKPIIKSDLFYMVLQFLFGFTNGHCLSSSFMSVGQYVVGEMEREAAGGFCNVFLSLGLVAGSLLSYIFV